MATQQNIIDRLSDRITAWVGSTTSIVLHTLAFVFALSAHSLFGWDFNTILLVLTTAVSLEAIYLAIFIQRAVNHQADRLEDVEESIDEVEEALDDVEEALDEVEEAIDDVEEGLDDMEKQDKRWLKRDQKESDEQAKLLEELRQEMREIRRLLGDRDKK